MDTKIRYSQAILATLLIGFITTVQGGDRSTVVKEGSVEVRIEGVASEKGMVYASVFLSDEGFPSQQEAADKIHRAVRAIFQKL